jgi:hypothetical protein
LKVFEESRDRRGGREARLAGHAGCAESASEGEEEPPLLGLFSLRERTPRRRLLGLSDCEADLLVAHRPDSPRTHRLDLRSLNALDGRGTLPILPGRKLQQLSVCSDHAHKPRLGDKADGASHDKPGFWHSGGEGGCRAYRLVGEAVAVSGLRPFEE